MSLIVLWAGIFRLDRTLQGLVSHTIAKMAVETRPARATDLPEILRLLAQLPLDQKQVAQPDDQSAREVLELIIASPGRTLIVAEDGGHAVGLVDLVTVPNLTHRAAPWAIIENLIVDEEHRRKGIGSTLMKDAIKRAREAGCYKIQLLSNAVRRDTHHFYESQGFEQSAEGFRLYFDNA